MLSRHEIQLSIFKTSLLWPWPLLNICDKLLQKSFNETPEKWSRHQIQTSIFCITFTLVPRHLLHKLFFTSPRNSKYRYLFTWLCVYCMDSSTCSLDICIPWKHTMDPSICTLVIQKDHKTYHGFFHMHLKLELYMSTSPIYMFYLHCMQLLCKKTQIEQFTAKWEKFGDSVSSLKQSGYWLWSKCFLKSYSLGLCMHLV